jgi:hypothetical protein
VSDSGPAFLTNFLVVAALFILTGIVALLAFFKKFQKMSILLLVILGFTYNLSLIEQNTLHFSVPNPRGPAMAGYSHLFEISQGDPFLSIGHIQTVNNDALVYSQATSLLRTKQEYSEFAEKIQNYEGYLLFIDFPKLPKDSIVVKTINQCALMGSFSDKNVNFAHIYDCKQRTDN